MTALYIILAILLLISLLLIPYVKIIFKYIDNEALLEIKYLFVTFSPLVKEEPRKPKKEKKRKPKKSKTKKNSENEPVSDEKENTDETENNNPDEKEKTGTEKKKKKKSDNIIAKAKDNWEFIVTSISSGGKMLRKILSKIFIYDLVIDFTISGEDACETAINYGKTNVAVYNGISFLRMFFDTKIKTVDIACDFDGKESKYDCEISARIRVITIIAAVIVFTFTLLKARNSESPKPVRNKTAKKKKK